MTEAQARRVTELVDSRDNIRLFLSTRDMESAEVKEYLESEYEHQRRDGRKLPGAKMAEIDITDAGSFEEESPDTLYSVVLLRDVLETGLRHALICIAVELAELGITSEEESNETRQM